MKYLILFSLFLIGCNNFSSTESGCPDGGNPTMALPDGRPTILVIGDSISIGWSQAIIDNDMLPDYQIIHSPCNAEDSLYTLDNIISWLSTRSSYYAIIFNNGIWDAVENRAPWNYINNELSIERIIKKFTHRPLFLTTTAVPAAVSNISDVEIQDYNVLAKDNLVTVFDLHKYTARLPISNEHIAPNNVHYTARGYKDIAKVVLTELRKRYNIK